MLCSIRNRLYNVHLFQRPHSHECLSPELYARCATQIMASKRKIRRHQVIINNGAIKADKRPGPYERYFWIFAFGVILISILTCVFDFSLKPPSPASAGASSPPRRRGGLFITRPYYGLHSWGSANRAWNARSHVKYGLGYTKGTVPLL